MATVSGKQEEAPLPLEKLYGKAFFARRLKQMELARSLARCLIAAFAPTSVVDVGCANGLLIATLSEQGVPAWGIDGSTACLSHLVVNRNRVLIHDLRLPLRTHLTPYPVDMAISMEVAEHIEAEYAGQFLDTLVSLAPRVFLTAAPPGQRGRHHVHCQSQAYWIERMAWRGYHYTTAGLVDYLALLQPLARSRLATLYYRNAMYFEKGA